MKLGQRDLEGGADETLGLAGLFHVGRFVNPTSQTSKINVDPVDHSVMLCISLLQLGPLVQ